jgi:hypothetical protein
MYFFCKKLDLWKVFGFNVKQKKSLLSGKVKIIRIKVKKVFLFKVKI